MADGAEQLWKFRRQVDQLVHLEEGAQLVHHNVLVRTVWS
jgi:hypothetical protein